VLPDSEDESWAKIRLDPAGVELLPELLPRIGNAVSRAVIWGALRDGLLDARVSPDTYVATAAAALPHEANDLVLGRVLTESASRTGTYIHTPEQRERLQSLLEELLGAAAAGSNRQLVVSRQLLRVSSDVDALWSWLDGHAPEGLLVDSDMRWRVLEQLCVLGAAGRDEILRERAADPSSQGALAALRCSAALPTVDGKSATWDRIISDPDISNHDLCAICESFFRASQESLTRPYYARYFTDLPPTAKLRGGWLVELSCIACYPRFAASDEILALADNVLAQDDLDPFVRRAFSDGTDDLRRLRASRMTFGGS
jgi:aminopeptidase N